MYGAGARKGFNTFKSSFFNNQSTDNLNLPFSSLN